MPNKSAGLILAISVFILAAQPTNSLKYQGNREYPGPVVRIVSGWNFDTSRGTISWTVVENEAYNHKTRKTVIKHYELDLHKAKMQVGSKARDLNPYETLLIHRQIELITRFIADSMGWWHRLEEQQSPTDSNENEKPKAP